MYTDVYVLYTTTQQTLTPSEPLILALTHEGKRREGNRKDGREGKEEEEQQHLFPKCPDDLALHSESQQMSANFSTITDAGLTLMIGCPQEPGRGVHVRVRGVFLGSISIITMNQEMQAGW